ncbi:hypothetical protein N6H14_15435 [Paenibacillus sp. CC-CFT747]|nr:hypothetical protein N6H14_15435 [Paenibacillus sp. CC-CFT747]
MAGGRLRLAGPLALGSFLVIQLLGGSFRPQGGLVPVLLPFLNADQAGYLELGLTRYAGFGFPFVMAGVLLARYEQAFLHVRLRPYLLPLIGLNAVEAWFLMRYAEWSPDYRLALSLLPNTVLLFYGILKVRSQTVRRYHGWINRFAVVTFCAHIPLMALNLYVLNWKVESMSGWQDLAYLALTLAECLLVTYLAGRRWRRQAGKPAGREAALG